MEGMDIPPANIQKAEKSFSPKFIEYIKSVENAQKVGFRNGKWYPHPAPEGGMPEIGYGHKIKKGEEHRFVNGISDTENEKLLRSDLEVARKQLHSDVKQMFKVQVPLDQIQEEMLLDFAYNLGNLRDFPKFARAVLNRDWDTVKKEYERSYVDNRGIRRKLSRNKSFYNYFLRNLPTSTKPLKEVVK